MKKNSKAIALASALLLLVTSLFTACSDGGDGGINPPISGPTPTPSPSPTPTPTPTPTGDEFSVSFSAEGTSTYVDGVYTLIAKTATEAGSTWANQIFISNPNKAAGIAANDKIHATITVKSDKKISGFFFKDQFNGAPNYPGIDNGASISALEANVSKTIDLYGTVAGDYNANNACFIIDLRGNEANTKLELSDIKVEKLGAYDITHIDIATASTKISAGETLALTTVDQYGFPVEGVAYSITSPAEPKSAIQGSTLVAGNVDETVVVQAKLTEKELTATTTITVTAQKDYGKYFQKGKQYGANDPVANDYMALWYVPDAGWGCGPVVELDNVTASATEYSLTRNTTGDKDWSTQISYRTAPGTYAVSFKVKSTAAGKIAVLPSAVEAQAVAVDLEANVEKPVAFITSVAEDNGKLMQINLGSGSDILPTGTFTLSNFKVENASTVTVSSVQVVPSVTSIVASGKVNLSATVNNEYAVSGATFAVTDGTGITGSKVEGNVLTVGEGAGKVSVTATYEGKTSDAVEITVTAAPTYSAPDLTGYYKKYFVTADTTVTKIDAAADTWSSGSKADKNTDGTYTLTSSDSMWAGVGGCVLAFSGNEGSGFVAGTIAKYDYVVLTLDLAAYELSSGDGNNGINVKVPNPNDNNVGQLSIANNWVKNADGTRTYYAALKDYSSTVNIATQVALIAGGKGTLVVKEFYIAAKNDPDASTPAPQPSGDAYTIAFSATENTYAYADGAYTLTINAATAANAEWANQIFIKNPNTKAGIAKGDYVRATVTAKADKAITKFFFKDQFNGGSYSGIDNSANLEGLEANVAKTFTIEGKVADDYDDSSSFVIDLRGNEAGTTLILTDIKVEKATEPTPTPVTFPYVVPSFTGKGDNGYTTIIKASDIPSDATKLTITIDSTKCSGSGDWWFGYGVSSWLGKVEWDAGINGYKAEITGDTLSAIKAGGLALVATSGLVCTSAITVSVAKDTPTPAGETLPFLPKGNNLAKIEGAGIWIYLDNTNLGITGANAAEIIAASTVSIKDHASGDAVTVSSWEFNDYADTATPKTVRLYVTMPDANHTTIDVTASLKIGTKTYSGTASFVNGVYQFDFTPTDITLSASAAEVKPSETVTFTVKGSPYDIDITDKCTFSIAEGDKTGSSISGKTLTAGATNGTVTVKAKLGNLEKTIDVKISSSALPTILPTSKIEGAGVQILISKEVVATTPAKEDITVSGKLETTEKDFQSYVSDNLTLNVVETNDQGTQSRIYFTQPAGFPDGKAITETFVIKWGKVTVNAVFEGNALKTSSVEIAQ